MTSLEPRTSNVPARYRVKDRDSYSARKTNMRISGDVLCTQRHSSCDLLASSEPIGGARRALVHFLTVKYERYKMLRITYARAICQTTE